MMFYLIQSLGPQKLLSLHFTEGVKRPKGFPLVKSTSGDPGCSWLMRLLAHPQSDQEQMRRTPTYLRSACSSRTLFYLFYFSLTLFLRRSIVDWSFIWICTLYAYGGMPRKEREWGFNSTKIRMNKENMLGFLCLQSFEQLGFVHSTTKYKIFPPWENPHHTDVSRLNKCLSKTSHYFNSHV